VNRQIVVSSSKQIECLTRSMFHGYPHFHKITEMCAKVIEGK